MKRAILVAVTLIAVSGGAAVVHWQLYLPSECRGDVPNTVEFRQGMTLCPGQSAIATFAIKP